MCIKLAKKEVIHLALQAQWQDLRQRLKNLESSH